MFEVRNLSSAYGQSEVLHGIDLSVAPGEIVAAGGPQRHGQVHADEIADRRHAGSLGPDRRGRHRRDRACASHQRVACGLAYVPQGRQIFGTMTVKENIETGLVVTGKSDIPRRDLRSVSDPGGFRGAARRQSLGRPAAAARDRARAGERSEGPAARRADRRHPAVDHQGYRAAAARHPQHPQSLHRRLRAGAELRARRRRPHPRHGERPDRAHRQPRACRRSGDRPLPGGLTHVSRPTERNHAPDNGQDPRRPQCRRP